MVPKWKDVITSKNLPFVISVNVAKKMLEEADSNLTIRETTEIKGWLERIRSKVDRYDHSRRILNLDKKTLISS